MKKYRLIYGCLCILTVFLAIVFGNRYVFVLLILELVLPLLLSIMLKIETKYVTTSVTSPHGCVAGEKCPLNFEFMGKLPFVATGVVHVSIEFKNVLYGRSISHELVIPSTHSRKKYEIMFMPVSCGEEHIICKEIVCYDIFGINKVQLKPLNEQVIVVAPKFVSLQLLESTVPSGRHEGRHYDYTKKGNDTSEVFDLREYQNGDAVRSIHWKLSGKLDKLIVKEPGYSSHYDTMVIFDVGKGNGTVVFSETVISSAMDFAVTFSKKLLELHRSHYVAMLKKDEMVLKEIESMGDLVQLIQHNMGMSLPDKTGNVISHFLVQNMQEQFSKLLYIVDGEFPEILYQIAGTMEITAICITDKKEEISMVERGISTLIEIPAKELYEHTHYIYV